MMMQKHEAIYALYPNVATIKNDVAYDANNDVVEYDKKLVDDWVNSKSYITQRKNAYPSVGDQLDMLWHTINNNQPLDKTSPFFVALQDVKNKYPKS